MKEKEKSGMVVNPILSICIPTWNRASILNMSLNSFEKQFQEIDSNDVEIFISDNCSNDDTGVVVQSYISRGLPITYSRNDQNIGAARNFRKCIENASGEYILLLGDDDLLKDGALKYILNQLRNKEYGLVFIYNLHKASEPIVFHDVEKFFREISFWLTFMSGCIFRKDISNEIDSDKYLDSHLLQMPYYIESAISRDSNLILNEELLEDGLDSKNNGGFNFYEVFVVNYLGIWEDFIYSKRVSKRLFKFIKKDLYFHFLLWHIYEQLLFKHNVRTESLKGNAKNRKGYFIKGAKRILFNHYGRCWYYYFTPFYFIYALIKYGTPRN